MTTLRLAIGDYPHTLPLKRGEIKSDWLKLDFVEVKPMHTAFKPMVREHAYDASEMALVIVLQAKERNKGLKLLPASMLARFQHHTMLHNAERGRLTPADLAGKRIGVRSYSQTTGAWLRGILQNDYGVDFAKVRWVTFEDGHVAEAKDPPGVERSKNDMTQMLIDGELDAAIYGAAMPDDKRLQSVIPNPEAAAKDWFAKYKLVPVNHMVVVTDEYAKANPDAVNELYRLLEAGWKAAGGKSDIPFGKDANAKAIELLTSYAVQQKLIAQPIAVGDLY
ncbi:MAG: ABC transporter substrate-binding protein [Pseudolabrys sp.]|nr:ABC transporter substrate-binding protein [Pseudolabrys sp.]